MRNNKVVARDIINDVKEITFNYKECFTKIIINNDIVNIGITKVANNGFIIERHKTFTIKKHSKYIALMINRHLKYIDLVYNELLEEEYEMKNNNIVEFKI